MNRLNEITQLEEQHKNRIKWKEEIFQNLWNTIKRNNVWIIGVPEGEEE